MDTEFRTTRQNAGANSASPSRCHSPSSVEQLTQKNIETIVRLEAAARESQTLTERLAKIIADFCGRMTFVWIHVIWLGGWIIANVLPGIKHFDEFPFTFLTLVVSLEAIFLSTFILISQNQETQLTECNNQLDSYINILTEQENTKMLQMLKRIADKRDAEIGDDPTAHVLEQSTCPEELVEQITQTKKQKKVGQDKME